MNELIRCRREGCRQVIAERWQDGSIKPVVIDWYQDPRGRLTVSCPACDERNRLPETRRSLDAET